MQNLSNHVNLDLSKPELLEIVEELWNYIATCPEELELTKEQKLELDARLEEHYKNPKEGFSWEEVEASIKKAHGIQRHH